MDGFDRETSAAAVISFFFGGLRAHYRHRLNCAVAAGKK